MQHYWHDKNCLCQPTQIQSAPAGRSAYCLKELTPKLRLKKAASRVPMATGCLGLLLSGPFVAATAHGQDALFSSVSLDQFIAGASSRGPAPPPAARHFGPVNFDLGGYLSATYDDNINASEVSPQSDVISQIGANINLNWAATDYSQLQFGTSLGYLNYQTYTANNGLEINPNSALTYAISLDDVIVTFFDQLSYSREVRTEAALVNVTTLPQLNNNVGARVEWDPGHWTWLASYSHDDYVSDHANDFLNRASEYFYARGGWRFAAATQAGLEASDGLTRYQVFSQNDSQNISLGGYLNWQVRPAINFTLRGGPTFYAPSRGSTLSSYYVSLEASHQINDYLSHSLTLQRSLQPALNQGGSFLQQLNANYAISWSLTRWVTASLTASYVDGQQSLAPVITAPHSVTALPSTENYQQWGVGLQLLWQCTAHLSTSAQFHHWDRQSSLANRAYTDNSISLQLNYTY
jgi:hypothetical protein